MDSNKGNWLSNLLILAAGVAMCFLLKRDNILTTIVYVLGFMFLATGIINLIMVTRRKAKGKTGSVGSTVGWIAGIGGIGLGAAMVFSTASFTPVLVYVFAFGLILAGLWQFIAIGYGFKPCRMPGWMYFVALVILVAGVVILCSSTIRENDRVCVIITAIGAILFAVLGFIQQLVYTSLMKNQKAVAKPSEATESTKVTDVEAQEVHPESAEAEHAQSKAIDSKEQEDTTH